MRATVDTTTHAYRKWGKCEYAATIRGKGVIWKCCANKNGEIIWKLWKQNGKRNLRSPTDENWKRHVTVTSSVAFVITFRTKVVEHRSKVLSEKRKNGIQCVSYWLPNPGQKRDKSSLYPGWRLQWKKKNPRENNSSNALPKHKTRLYFV